MNVEGYFAYLKPPMMHIQSWQEHKILIISMLCPSCGPHLAETQVMSFYLLNANLSAHLTYPCLFGCKGLCSMPLMGTGMREQPLVRPFPYPEWQYKSQQTSTLRSPPSSDWGGVSSDQDIYCILLPKAMPMRFT